MKRLFAAIGLALLVFASASACTVSRTASPGSGENWASQRATQR